MADWVTGIDVSMHQGAINWYAVRQAGIGYAFIKTSEGVGYTDPRWLQNRGSASAAGVPWGGYHFARPDSGPGDARAEARWFLACGGDTGQLPAVLDLEETTMEREQTIQWAADFCDEMHRVGSGRRTYILYSGAYFMGSAIAADPRLRHCYWWLPNYGSNSPNPNPYTLRVPSVNNGVGEGWDIWQYSSRGAVTGVPGDCDMNVIERSVLAQMLDQPLEDEVLTDEDLSRITAMVDSRVSHLAEIVGHRAQEIGAWLQGERGWSGTPLVGLHDGGIYTVLDTPEGIRKRHITSPDEVAAGQDVQLWQPAVFVSGDIWGEVPRPGLLPLSPASAAIFNEAPLAGPDPNLTDAEKAAVAQAVVDGIAARGVPSTLTPAERKAIAEAVADEGHERTAS